MSCWKFEYFFIPLHLKNQKGLQLKVIIVLEQKVLAQCVWYWNWK